MGSAILVVAFFAGAAGAPASLDGFAAANMWQRGGAEPPESVAASLMQVRLSERPDEFGVLGNSSDLGHGNVTELQGIRLCEICLESTTAFEIVTHKAWCPADQKCYEEGSLQMPCDVPIKAVDECWGQRAVNHLSSTLTQRSDVELLWARAAVLASKTDLHPFPTYPPCGLGIFDLVTGEALTNATWGCGAEDVVM